MFLRIYLGLIGIILAAIMASYLLFSTVNQARLITYNEAVYSGTFSLIQEGLRRHSGDTRDQWLSIVKRLSGLDLKRPYSNEAGLSANELSSLKAGEIVFRFSAEKGTFHVFAAITDTQKDNFQLVSTSIKSVTEQQLRVSALLVLNELGRFSPEERAVQIERLQSNYSYPLLIQQLDQLALDNKQAKRLKRGDVVVVLEIDTKGEEALTVYSLIDKEAKQALVLGPIPTFQQTPIPLLVTLLLVSLFITGLGAYLMVRRLEIRLRNMSSMVKKFGPGFFNTRLQDQGIDTVSKLAGSFNGMAERISDLINDQKHMTQAVAHELRTPISRMKFRLDMLSNLINDTKNTDAQEKIHGLRKDLDELNHLVDETLFFHQLEAVSHQKAESEVSLANQTLASFNIIDCIQSVESKTAPLYPEKHIVINLPEQSNYLIEAYLFYLTRLLQNLIVNGLRYSHSCVHISFVVLDEDYQLIIEDDGIGIDQQYASAVFQPFQRIDSSRNKALGGYGLGLAIVERIAHMHQGNVSLSESKLGGACFTFKWPKKLMNSIT
jgi:two-component system sensor histidine kinase RstB